MDRGIMPTMPLPQTRFLVIDGELREVQPGEAEADRLIAMYAESQVGLFKRAGFEVV